MLSMSSAPPSADWVACMAALAGPRRTTRQAMAVGSPRWADRVARTFSRAPACQAMSSPAATNPMLLNVLAGCRTNQSRGASQKFAPRPMSGPSQPRPIATASRPTDTTAVVPATMIGLRSGRIAIPYRPVGGLGTPDRSGFRVRIAAPTRPVDIPLWTVEPAATSPSLADLATNPGTVAAQRRDEDRRDAHMHAGQDE